MSGLAEPRERLLRFVQFHIEWHTARKEEVFIGNMELRSLSASQYRKVVALRKQYEDFLLKILADGAKARLWKLDDPRVTTYALLSMLTGISNWYRPRGRLSAARLLRIYEHMVTRLVGTEDGPPQRVAAKRPAASKR
jgi:hypothetical protein